MNSREHTQVLSGSQLPTPHTSLRLLILGDSIASGLGVTGVSYPELLIRHASKHVTLENWSRTGRMLNESVALLPEVVAFQPQVTIVAHGIFEAILKPSETAMRFVPQRWQKKGWLDPRPYFSQRRVRGAYQRIESAIRWRYRNLLIRQFGSTPSMPLRTFRQELDQLVETLLTRTDSRIILVTHVGIDERLYPQSLRSLDTFAEELFSVSALHSRSARMMTCDVRSTLNRWSDFFSDHFHPNVFGHRRIADALRPLIYLE